MKFSSWRAALLLIPLCLAGCPSEEADDTPPPIIEIPNPFDQQDAGDGAGDEPDEGNADGPGAEDGCCSDVSQCDEGMRCIIDPTVGQGLGLCLPDVQDDGGCYMDEDCPATGTCVNAILCLCSDCEEETVAGVCQVPCCITSADCEGSSICLSVNGDGQCNVPAEGEQCWADFDCESNVCVGANPCECGQDCDESNAPGACQPVGEEPDCLTDDDCGTGSCMAGAQCTDACPAGDPSCCTDNQCIEQTNECLSDSDCREGVCTAGPICYPWCDAGDPGCCFGNVCFLDPCLAPSPAGCLFSGCEDGKACVVDETCVPTACSCTPSAGWSCSDDCVGGQCKVSTCIGPNPQGCGAMGCVVGQTCTPSDTCVPTACSCDEANGAWACSADCAGGVCQ